MSLKEKWAAKKELKKETFEYEGEEVTVREMSGLEKVHMEEIEDLVEISWFIWKNCVLSESLAMTKEEFLHAFDKAHTEVDHIIARAIKLSTRDDKEKN